MPTWPMSPNAARRSTAGRPSSSNGVRPTPRARRLSPAAARIRREPRFPHGARSRSAGAPSPRRAIERVGPHPDRLALWALLMGLVLILVAVGTADASVLAR